MRSTPMLLLQLLLLAPLLCVDAGIPPTPPPPPLAKATPGSQKNIIFLLTDDQDLRLGSMGAMPFLRENVLAAGANLTSYFICTPICCPSRTTFMSGKYVHNNKVSSVSAGGCMRQNTSRCEGSDCKGYSGNPSFWTDSFIHRLRYDHGYTTGIFGKLLNAMDTYGCDGQETTAPHGLDRTFIMCNPAFANEKWADYTTSGGSVYTTAGGTTMETGVNYTTSLVGNMSLAWVKSIVEMGKDHPPFFAYLGPHAPHLPSTPAPWYADHPIGLTPVPIDAIYNYSATDKHSFLATEPIIDELNVGQIADEHAKRLRSLLSVDDIVKEFHAYLTSVDEWDRTYFFYTSDHGYQLGQFRVDSHKTQVYDHVTMPPAMVRGPGIPAGVEHNFVATMADFGPTILELAGGPSAVPPTMDGMSYARMLTAAPGAVKIPWKDAALIEYKSIRDTDTINTAETLSDEAKAELVSAYGYRTLPGSDEPLYPWARRAGDGNATVPNYHDHDGPNNTFSALRIINETSGVNMMYSEFVNVLDPLAWDFAPARINFYELYDVSKDYYMMHNIFPTASDELKDMLHKRLQTAIKCKGATQCHEILA